MCCAQYASKSVKLSSCHRTGKGQFSFQCQRKAIPKGNPKECSNYYTIALVSHASKVILKILQARLQQYLNLELPDVQVGFRKGRGMRDRIANVYWIIEKAREFQKNNSFWFIDFAKSFDCVDHNKLWKIFKKWEYQTTLPTSWETCMQVKKQPLEPDIEQRTGPKLGKEYIKLYIVILLIQLTCRGHHVKCRVGWSTSRNQDLQEKYQ